MKGGTTSDYIYRLIAQGEHQQQDFKFEISDARKIAKSISAFYNTEGGRLLVGVKDNGKIAGVRTEEEIYMVEAAAKLYCKPQVEFQTHTHTVEGKKVLEVIVPEGKEKPCFAIDYDGQQKAYVRVKDENILATAVHLKLWRSEKSKKGAIIRYSEKEQVLLSYLNENSSISLKQYIKLADIPRFLAINILAKLVSFGIIEMFYNDRIFCYRNTTE
ncbi:MAG: ATP-binding protein [Odoribacter sp.]|nr:ATP-binding protein [Odoribacter sp.]